MSDRNKMQPILYDDGSVALNIGENARLILEFVRSGVVRINVQGHSPERGVLGASLRPVSGNVFELDVCRLGGE